MSDAAKGGQIAPVGSYGGRYVPSEYVVQEQVMRSTTAPATTTMLGMASLLWRWRWVIIGSAFGTAVLALVIAKQFTPLYTADGAMVVASSRVAIPQLQTLANSTDTDANVRSQMAVMSSRSVLRQVAAQLDLAAIPEFNPALRPKDTSLIHELDPRPLIHSLFTTAKPKQSADTTTVLNDAIETTLRQNLSLVNDGRSFIVNIDYRSEDPVLAGKIVNALMQVYLHQAIENTLAATVAANDSLQKRADDLKVDLANAEQKLEDYSAKAGLIITPQGTVAAQQVTDLATQLAQARSEQAQANAAYMQLRANGGGGLVSDPAVLASPVIQQLRAQEAAAERNRSTLAAQVGPKHPDLIAANREVAGLRAQINAEIGKVGRSIKTQSMAADARVAELEKRQAALQKEGATQTAQQTVLQTLQDDVTSKRKLYDDFLITMAQTAKPGDTPVVDARIISSADTPIGPSSPRFGIIGLLAAIVGALGATAWVLGYSQLDSGFDNLTDVEAATGLPGFASIPHVRGIGRRRLPDQYVLDNPNSPFTEALRALRARVWWATRDRTIKTVLVTSSNPGEGKSSFSLSLGRLAAKEGYRVLLLECDFRRPSLEGALPQQSVGGSPNFLADPANWRHWVGTDPVTGMQYLTASDDNRNIAAMLEAGRLETILEEAKDQYDLLIIDSPPIMKVPDAMLLARSADVVMMMVRWRSTRKRVVQEAIRRLYISPEKLAGVVLTEVDPRHAEQDMYAGYA